VEERQGKDVMTKENHAKGSAVSTGPSISTLSIILEELFRNGLKANNH
jgi:hypothetical protein